MYSYAVEVYSKQFLLHQWHPSCYSCYHNLMTRYVELTKYWWAQKPDIIYPKWSDMSTCRLFFSTLALCNLIPVQNTKILTPDDHASVLFFVVTNPILLSSFLTSHPSVSKGNMMLPLVGQEQHTLSPPILFGFVLLNFLFYFQCFVCHCSSIVILSFVLSVL